MVRGTALVLLGSLAAGCSADAVRFTDSTIFTGATQNQREIIKNAPVNQRYPGDAQAASASGAHIGSVHRSALEPVDLTRKDVARADMTSGGRASLLPPAGKKVDPLYTGTVRGKEAEPTPVRMSEAGGGGWTRTGGTQVTLRQGETIYNLSRRFGVPAEAIMKANGISDATSVNAGTRIIIPTYVYSKSAPISAPDSNPKVAKASAGRGEIVEKPSEPKPSPLPERRREAVVPNEPKTRERVTDASADESKSAAKPDEYLGKTYKVVAGDTLYEIARKQGTTAAAIKEANGLSSGLIRVGQVLKIPGRDDEEFHSGRKPVPEGLDKTVTGTALSEKGGSSDGMSEYTPPVNKTDEVIKEARAEAPDGTGIGKMRWPARGRIIAEYGKTADGSKNDGIDIALPAGTPIKAAENGVVIYAGDGLKEFGNTVLLRHENGLVTVYGHASFLKVARGDQVKRGDEIARSGMSGSAYTPKLHFEVRDKSVPVDPMKYLQ